MHVQFTMVDAVICAFQVQSHHVIALTWRDCCLMGRPAHSVGHINITFLENSAAMKTSKSIKSHQMLNCDDLFCSRW